MAKFLENSANRAIVYSVLVLLLSSTLAFSLGEDLEKKYAPIIGTYEFYVEAQVMNIKFWVEEEKLWGAPEGETPGELEPMEGEEFKFEITTDDGQYYILDFVKDESGKYNKCIVQAMGMEMEGTRIEQ